MTTANPTTYQKIIKDTPKSLPSVVLEILKLQGGGKKSAVGRILLTVLVREYGYDIHERAVRQAIHDLRRDGWLICSMPGEDGGYYMAASLQEFEEFCQRELHPKAMDMLETESAMKASARLQFGEAVQLDLIR